MIKKKNRKPTATFMFLCIILGMLMVLIHEEATLAATGYTDHGHAWETPSKCSTCGGDHVISSTSTCGSCYGKGYTSKASSTYSNGVTKTSLKTGCSNCGGAGSKTCEHNTSGTIIFESSSATYKQGSGTITTNSNCSKCYASGTYKGKNTRCNNSGCSKGSYAAWADYPNGVCYSTPKTATVTFHINYGSDSTVAETFTYGVSNQKFGHTTTGTCANHGTGASRYGETGQFGGWDRTGYTLLGWSSSKTATFATYSTYSGVSNDWILQSEAGVHLYAVWKAKAQTIHYDANGGENAPEDQSAEYGVETLLSLNIPTRTGYTFKYWTSTTADLMKQEISINNNAYVEKVWLENYWENGTFYCKILVKAPSGLCIKLPTWTYDDAASDKGQDDIGSWTTNNIMTSGSWERGGDVYNYAWSFPISDRKYELGETQTQIYVYTSANQAWNANVGYASIPLYGYQFYPGDLYPGGYNGGTQTFYAQWSPNNYTTTFIPNGGSFKNSRGENIETVTMTYDTKDFWDISYGIIERKGFTFKGWYTEIEGGIQVYDAENKATNEGTYFQNNIWRYVDDVTLYAQWEGVLHTVTYDANGGTTPSREFVKYFDDVLDLSLTAEKPGYIFVGWNTNPDATTGLSSMKMKEEDITLYAIYSIDVSDIANHFYDENSTHIHAPLKEHEVFLRVWELENEENYRDYPLRYEFDAATMVYRYVIDADVSDYVKNLIVYGYALYAYDNAGNWAPLDVGVISEKTPPLIEDVPDPSPQKYEQTIKHYRYDSVIGDYIHFATAVEEIAVGERYKPLFITAPNGYQADRMEYPPGYSIAEDGSYIITATATIKAYYEPIAYTLTFDANGGTTSVNTKTVRYGDYYGDMPTPVRTGYTFIGWYTEKDGGDIVVSSDKYHIEGDCTLYAHWSINSYSITYDYWTNGGTGISTVSKQQTFDTIVDLSVTAVKPGWTHIGWNTNPDAVMGLEEYRMSAEDVTLYAVYKKDMIATFIDSYPARRNEIHVTIHNRQELEDIVIPAPAVIVGWEANGWTTLEEADSQAEYAAGGNYELSNSVTFYALYEKEVSLTYDTNGSPQTYSQMTRIRYYNASGNWKNPSIIVSDVPTREQYSFVEWSVSGAVVNTEGIQITHCMPGNEILLESNVTLKALWDAYPQIEAYNRHFTLDQARSGYITEEELLRKVKVTDEEAKHESNPEGILENERNVIVLDFSESTITSLISDTEVQMTYEATDGFGNKVTKTIAVTVTDTTLKESPKKSYVRFISRQFFADKEGNLIPESKGGLEETSIWRTNETYRNLLQNTLFNRNTDAETWVFTKKDIEKMKKKL